MFFSWMALITFLEMKCLQSETRKPRNFKINDLRYRAKKTIWVNFWDVFSVLVSDMATKMNGKFLNDMSIGNHKRIFLFIFSKREIRHNTQKPAKDQNLLGQRKSEFLRNWTCVEVFDLRQRVAMNSKSFRKFRVTEPHNEKAVADRKYLSA